MEATTILTRGGTQGPHQWAFKRLAGGPLGEKRAFEFPILRLGDSLSRLGSLVGFSPPPPKSLGFIVGSDPLEPQ